MVSFYLFFSLLSKSNPKPWSSINLSEQENSMRASRVMVAEGGRDTASCRHEGGGAPLCSLNGRGLIVCSHAPPGRTPPPRGTAGLLYELPTVAVAPKCPQLTKQGEIQAYK